MNTTPKPTPARIRRGRGLVAATALALGLGTGLAACGEESVQAASNGADQEQSATVTIGDPWVRATEGAEDTSMSAAFMTIDNEGADNVILTGASTPVAGTVEIHEMAMVDGASTMQAMTDGLEITAGRGKLLEPGGYHVMLMDLNSALEAGDEVELTLEFSDGSTKELVVPVKVFTEEEGHYHEPGTEEHDDMSHDDMEGSDS